MKKHPVDDLFKGKLSGLEREPSAAAWSRIAIEQKKDRKVFAWVWYAAASVLVVATAGYLVWNGGERQGLSDKPVIAHHDKVKAITEPLTDSHTKEFIAAGKENIVPAKVNIQVRASVNNAPKTKLPATDTERYTAAIRNDNVTKEIEAITPTLKIVEPVAQVKREVPAEPLRPVILQNAIASAEPVTKEENRTIVVNVEESESVEKPKASRFTKVFRQLKNVRAGEPVDWQDVGFNPKAIIAKVDGRGHSQDDNDSDKFQSKERRKY